MLTSLTDSVEKSSHAFFVVILLFVCVFVILVRNYHTTLSSHEFAGFNMLTDSVDKSSPALFVFTFLFVCVFIILVRNSIAIFCNQIMCRTDSLSQIS